MNTANTYSLKQLLFCYLTLLIACGWSSCKPDSEPPLPEPSSAKELLDFAFLQKNNPTLEEDIYLVIKDDSLFGHLPLTVALDTLVATFTTDAATVTVAGETQRSGKDVVDFRKPVAYTVTAEDGSEAEYHVQLTYFTGLPIVRLQTTDGQMQIARKRYKDAKIEIYGGANLPDLPNQAVEIRGRGNSSWNFPKKPYQIKFPEQTAVLGIPADRRWVLIPNYSDKTMLRNFLGFSLSQMTDLAWTPKGHFVELFLNGDYRGTYQLLQKVEETNNRVDIAEDAFLLEADQIERLDDDDIYFWTDRQLFNIKEPKLTANSSDYRYIRDYIREVEEVLYNENLIENGRTYQDYLAIESVVDWYLVNEIARNVDAIFYSSVYLHHERGGKLYLGPVWDFDLAFGNVDYSDSRHPRGFRIKNSKWIEPLFNDPAFVNLVKQRYQHFYNNKDKIINLIRRQAKLLDRAQEENDRRWETIGVYVWPNNVVLNTYAAEVDYLVDWLDERMEWLAGAMEEL